MSLNSNLITKTGLKITYLSENNPNFETYTTYFVSQDISHNELCENGITKGDPSRGSGNAIDGDVLHLSFS